MSKKVFNFKIALVNQEKFKFTLSKHPSESVQYFLIKAIAFALNYNKELQVNSQLCHGELPDIFIKSHTFPNYKLWIEIGGNSLGKIKKNIKKTSHMKIYISNSKTQLQRYAKNHAHLEVFQLTFNDSDFIGDLNNMNVHWNIFIENDKIIINDITVKYKKYS